MVDRLASVLQDLAKRGELVKAVEELQQSARNSDADRRIQAGASFKDIPELVQHYKQRQQFSRTSGNNHKNPSTKCYSLNFAQYRRQGRFGYEMMPPGKMQISGFTDDDTYSDVIAKGAKGLNITAPLHSLKLLLSGGLVSKSLFQDDKEWSLGQFTVEIGGVQIRSKKVFGLYIPMQVPNDFASGLADVEGFEGDTTPASKKPRLSSSHANTNNDAIIHQMKDPRVEEPVVESLSDNDIRPDDVESKLVADSITAEYSPLSGPDLDIVSTIRVTGQEGIWRLVNCQCHISNQELIARMEDDLWNIQPENLNFVLMKVQSGGTTYLKAVMEADMNVNNIKFIVHEKRLVHSPLFITLEKQCMWPPVPLLVISPSHGQISYKWEKKSPSKMDWEDMAIPPFTCLLYVDTAQQYKCTVDGESVIFNVQVKTSVSRSRSTKEFAIDHREITYGKLIGRGGFGSVYRGKYKGMDVALKEIQIPAGIDKEQILTTSRELKALRMLKHPNIVTMLGYSVTPNQLIIIMNLIEGKNLHIMLFGNLKQKIMMSADQKLDISKGIATGVHYMHHHNPIVIHRDLKPLNIMVTTDLNHVYVCDMGIAKLRGSVDDQTATTKVVGTYSYMPPEMFDKSYMGTEVDIYSLGCLYIELFGERRVWPGLSNVEIMKKVCGSFATAPTMVGTQHLPIPYARLCRECCQLNPKDRVDIDNVIQQLNNITL